MKAPRAYGRFSFDPYAAFFTILFGILSVVIVVAAIGFGILFLFGAFG